MLSFLFTLLLVNAAVVHEDVVVEGAYLKVEVTPEGGGAVRTFTLTSAPGNSAGEDGVLQEGFGVGSYYVPNRRLNERLEVLEDQQDRPVFRYSYDCDGPNIRGLRSVRTMEPLLDEASMRVTWEVENQGDETQWVAPWVQSNLAPGGRLNETDRLDLPTLDGLLHARGTAYHPAARNWFAATDGMEKQSFCAVFDAEQTHAFMSIWEPEEGMCGGKAAFVPFALAPGERWKTTYRLNAVRGLTRVDFATDELACQVDWADGKLVVLVSPVLEMKNLSLRARVVGANGRVWTLPNKRFDVGPNRLARCTYEWLPPGDGHYEFLGQLLHDETPVDLGGDTRPPHGGIDTRFTVGRVKPAPFAAWTNAPHALDRKDTPRRPALAAPGPLEVWFASSLEKVFPEDQPDRGAPMQPRRRISLARGERESFQVVLRPGGGTVVPKLRVHLGDLTHALGEARIPARDVSVYQVRYHDVRIPTHYEGPTGAFPDALLPMDDVSLSPGDTAPIWFTVYARPDLPAGVYTGMLEVLASGLDPIELWVEVMVYDFDLPRTPALKTDFDFWPEAAMAGAEALGGKLTREEAIAAYLQNALEHRVTLRPGTGFPAEQADYAQALEDYAPKMRDLLSRGVTTIAVPPSLRAFPELLRSADDFVLREGIQDRVFVPLAHEPDEPAWPRLLEAMQQWEDAAPDIPIAVTSSGLRPFVPNVLDRWVVHAQVFDTPINKELLREMAAGREVWWYVDHAPPRPYGNLFLDFAAMEHRMLFWQAWALGIRGMHYWNINYLPPGSPPYDTFLDITPANGDGLLVYPGKAGPVNSIRWEVIRDGIEDYDYLEIFLRRRDALLKEGGHEALLARAAEVYNLEKLIPNLVDFTRDPATLGHKREAIARMVEEMGRALGQSQRD